MPAGKELVWIGSSRKDIRAFPVAVRALSVWRLDAVQLGETPPAGEPLKGFRGAGGIAELIEDI